ncbi:unnamed protein product [Rotaria magnacalcarata]|uniref:Uncharacterized protein n=1 Tax=Rotaria magnacalcarata TaxID=392030 RepID=A0A816TLI9_9BILA|nr:unnamed protein product [Rotaria magnacalcarata]
MRGYNSFCLDWREVCDGKVDCWPKPVDEQDCHELEQNECGSGEYRCRNGQCIPEDNVADDLVAPDCLDWTDEVLQLDELDYNSICHNGYPSLGCYDAIHAYWTQVKRTHLYCYGEDSCRSKYTQMFHRNVLERAANLHINDDCWATMICLFYALSQIPLDDPALSYLFNITCKHICQESSTCMSRKQQFCPPLFEFPAQSIGWNDVHLFHSWNSSYDTIWAFDFVCYSEQLCDSETVTIQFAKITEPTKLLSCQKTHKLELKVTDPLTRSNQIESVRILFSKICAIGVHGVGYDCSQSNQFRCGKKCISKHRLVDGLRDCTSLTDELYNDTCSLKDRDRIKCTFTFIGKNDTKCVNLIWVNKINGGIPCVERKKKTPHFPTICDGYVEYEEIVDGEINTDETHCENWLCDNSYTRCDGIWNCRNGADEVRCPRLYCNGIDQHPCISPTDGQIKCLSISQAGDGVVDCLGGADERQLCRRSSVALIDYIVGSYHCLNNQSNGKQINQGSLITQTTKNKCIEVNQLCDNVLDCPLHDDESSIICKGISNAPFCDYQIIEFLFPLRILLCSLDDTLKLFMWGSNDKTVPHFSLANYSISPPYSPISPSIKTIISSNVSEESSLTFNSHRQATLVAFHCHSGIPVHLSRNESKLSPKEIEKRCLCPPSHYGAHCEYQNQRVVVTMRIGSIEWQIAFKFVVYLIDNANHIVQSYHQVDYVSNRDCGMKFSFHLLYAVRPKPVDRKYFIRIDVFETTTLRYRTSWLFELVHFYLPVYRLSIQLTVLNRSILIETRCPLKCHSKHGDCVKYVNTDKFFCRCHSGWSGPSCTEPYECTCSPDSICVGSWNKKPICVCPLRKFGSYCYLLNPLCEQTNAVKCQNNGQCVPRDLRINSNSDTICACSVDYRGKQCEILATKIHILFASLPSHSIPESILLHFITVNTHAPPPGITTTEKQWGPHQRTTVFKKVPFDQVFTTVNWVNPFHLLFAEFHNNMYLLTIQTTYVAWSQMKFSIEHKARCPSIRELLNSTIVAFLPIRRVKYYHIPCQQRLHLACFDDDEQFMCLCTYDRRANCFSFNHHLERVCQYDSYCHNGGQCFQDNATCPSIIICKCPKCYFGTQCHLSTKGFGLSLDVILGYRIRPYTAFKDQPLILKTSVIVTSIMLVVGLINGCLCTLTFKQKTLRKVGTGIYLLVASIVSVITMTMFTLKFCLLVLSQLKLINDRSILISQCISVDFLLKVFLQTGDWLYACVAMKRLFVVTKGTSFNQQTSQRVAKWIILLVGLFVIATSAHEPYHRALVTDEDEGRVWCIVRYPESYSKYLNIYTSVITIVHFIGPFAINIISVCGIIVLTARHRMNARKQLSFNSHLRNQLQLHKYLIISPVVLVLLGMPRLIIVFLVECMKSARDSVTSFLVAYFISFLPPTLTFVVFILPSQTYRNVFKTSMASLRKIFHRCLSVHK